MVTTHPVVLLDAILVELNERLEVLRIEETEKLDILDMGVLDDTETETYRNRVDAIVAEIRDLDRRVELNEADIRRDFLLGSAELPAATAFGTEARDHYYSFNVTLPDDEGLYYDTMGVMFDTCGSRMQTRLSVFAGDWEDGELVEEGRMYKENQGCSRPPCSTAQCAAALEGGDELVRAEEGEVFALQLPPGDYTLVVEGFTGTAYGVQRPTDGEYKLRMGCFLPAPPEPEPEPWIMSASSTFGTNGLMLSENAFDEDPETMWISDLMRAGQTGWVQVQLDHVVDLQGVAVTFPDTSEWGTKWCLYSSNAVPRQFTISVSLDGVAFDDLETVSDISCSVGRQFDVTTDLTSIEVRKRHFLRHLCIKVIYLPRQARDKHRENSKKGRFLAATRAPPRKMGARERRGGGFLPCKLLKRQYHRRCGGSARLRRA